MKFRVLITIIILFSIFQTVQAQDFSVNHDISEDEIIEGDIFQITFNLSNIKIGNEYVSVWSFDYLQYDNNVEFERFKIHPDWIQKINDIIWFDNENINEIENLTNGSYISGEIQNNKIQIKCFKAEENNEDYQFLNKSILVVEFKAINSGETQIFYNMNYSTQPSNGDGVYSDYFSINIANENSGDDDDDDNNDPGPGPTPPPQNNPPTADFSYSGNLTENQTVSFTDESTDSDGTIESYTWYFGEFGSSIKKNPTFIFPEDGTFDITLTVTDDDGATDSSTKPILIEPIFHRNNDTTDNTSSNQTKNITLKAVILCDSNVMRANETIYFSGDRCIGENLQYNWEFGDGKNATGSIVQHKYKSKGVYDVNLTITNSTGHQDNATKTFNISKAKQTPNPQEYEGNEYIFITIILLAFIFIVVMLLFNYFRYR